MVRKSSNQELTTINRHKNAMQINKLNIEKLGTNQAPMIIRLPN